VLSLLQLLLLLIVFLFNLLQLSLLLFFELLLFLFNLLLAALIHFLLSIGLLLLRLIGPRRSLRIGVLFQPLSLLHLLLFDSLSFLILLQAQFLKLLLLPLLELRADVARVAWPRRRWTIVVGPGINGRIPRPARLVR